MAERTRPPRRPRQKPRSALYAPYRRTPRRPVLRRCYNGTGARQVWTHSQGSSAAGIRQTPRPRARGGAHAARRRSGCYGHNGARRALERGAARARDRRPAVKCMDAGRRLHVEPRLGDGDELGGVSTRRQHRIGRTRSGPHAQTARDSPGVRTAAARHWRSGGAVPVPTRSAAGGRRGPNAIPPRGAEPQVSKPFIAIRRCALSDAHARGCSVFAASPSSTRWRPRRARPSVPPSQLRSARARGDRGGGAARRLAARRQARFAYSATRTWLLLALWRRPVESRAAAFVTRASPRGRREVSTRTRGNQIEGESSRRRVDA